MKEKRSAVSEHAPLELEASQDIRFFHSRRFYLKTELKKFFYLMATLNREVSVKLHVYITVLQ